MASPAANVGRQEKDLVWLFDSVIVVDFSSGQRLGYPSPSDCPDENLRISLASMEIHPCRKNSAFSNTCQTGKLFKAANKVSLDN